VAPSLLHRSHWLAAIGVAASAFLLAASSSGDAPRPAPTPEASVSTIPALSELREPVVEAQCTKAIIFLYHGFDRGSGALSVNSSTLDSHLDWLRRNRVATLSMDQLLAFLDGRIQLPAKVALIAIDDGDATVHSRAWPILRRHGARFVLGLPTRLMESGRRGLLSWDQVREMVDSGLAEVASHGHVHQGLVHFGAERAARELSLSRQILQERTGRVPQAFFYPLGSVDDRAEAFVRDAGFAAAFTAQGGPISRASTPRFRVPRVTVEHQRTSLAGFYGAKFWQPTAAQRAACEE